jgi:hypothetical protein
MPNNRHEEWNVNALSSHSTKHFYDNLSRNTCHPLASLNFHHQQQLNNNQQLLQIQSQNQPYQQLNYHYNSLKRIRPSPPAALIETPNALLPPINILPPPPPELNTTQSHPEQNIKTEKSFSILPPFNIDSPLSNENQQIFAIQWNPCVDNTISTRNTREVKEFHKNPSNPPSFENIFMSSNSKVMMDAHHNEHTTFESHYEPLDKLTTRLSVSSAPISFENISYDQNKSDLQQPQIEKNDFAMEGCTTISSKDPRSEGTLSRNCSEKSSWHLTNGEQWEGEDMEGITRTQEFVSDTKHESEAGNVCPNEEGKTDLISLVEKRKFRFEQSYSVKSTGDGYNNSKISESRTSLSEKSTSNEENELLLENATLDQSEPTFPEDLLITREEKLRLVKEKLQHARDHLVKVLKRKRSTSPIPLTVKLPPISALRQPLIIRPEFRNDEQSQINWIPLLPEPKLMDHPCEIVIPYTNFEEVIIDAEKDVIGTKENHNDLYKKGRALKKNLLLLKKKKLEITLRKQKELQKRKAEVKSCDIPIPLSKEALKKRQEELQQAVDVAYWKRLVIQQRNLLEAERLEVSQQNESIQAYQEEINSKLAAIEGCETTLRELRVREKCLDEHIAQAMQEVLLARKLRHDLHEQK